MMFLEDLSLAARSFRKSPMFTITAVLTIALGVGASTAIFSVTNAVLLRPLPYRDPNRLVVIYCDLRARADYGSPFSTENYLDIANSAKGAFADMAAVTTGRLIVPAEDGSPEQIRFGTVTTNFFQVLGARMAMGRDFSSADGEAQAQKLPATVILSYEYWRRRYGGNPDIIGRNLPGAGGKAQLVIGVLAPHFELLFPPADSMEAHPDIWIANRLVYDNANRNTYSLRPIGRLRPGVSLERAQAEVESAASRIRKSFPLYGAASLYARVEPMHRTLVAQVRPAILTLMGAVIFLMLIACANVANLLLVRASLRQRDLAVRAALGGKWRHLVQPMFAEALLLSALGATAGVGLAWLGVHELLAIAPVSLPLLHSIRLDWFAIAFTTATSLAAAIFFGLAPAWGLVRLDLMKVLRGNVRTAGLAGGGVLRNLVVVAEVALCFVLLIGSGLMFRSFVELQRINPGFDAHNLLTFRLLRSGGGQPERLSEESRVIRSRLRALPGVQNVTASFPFPLDGDFSTIRWGTAAASSDSSKFQAVDWQAVLPGYFETLKTPLLEGRTFSESDNDPKRNVVVIDPFLAAKAFPGESAVGKRILIRIRTPEPEWVDVIGVVAHQRLSSLADPGREQIYFTDGFLGFGATRSWAMRTGSDPGRYERAVRAELGRVNPQLLVENMQPAEELVARAQDGTRFALVLIGLFAAIATLLVAIGLYGVLSTVVRQRTAEIGVRMALGADPDRVLRLVVGQGLRLSAAGIIVGLAGAFALTRVMTAMLVGVKPTDPVTFAAMVGVFFAIAALSSWLPARRAAALDPVAALRQE